MSQKNVFVAGHAGMVGSAICRHLESDNSIKLITASRNELDLTNQLQVLGYYILNTFPFLQNFG